MYSNTTGAVSRKKHVTTASQKFLLLSSEYNSTKLPMPIENGGRGYSSSSAVVSCEVDEEEDEDCF
jgi:hypothetical protein